VQDLPTRSWKAIYSWKNDRGLFVVVIGLGLFLYAFLIFLGVEGRKLNALGATEVLLQTSMGRQPC
jgi:hypothetical protein